MKSASLSVMLIVMSTAGAIAAIGSQRVARAESSGMPMSEFHEVSPGIFRGSRPEPRGMSALSRAGIRTDLDVEDDDDVIAAEKADSAKAGIRFISMPMSGFWAPDDQEVGQILQLLNDPSLYPIYIHCQHGHDRTGLIIGLYRVFFQDWTPAAAYQEMLRMGFHPLLIFLNHYYAEKTGYDAADAYAASLAKGFAASFRDKTRKFR